MTEEELVGIWIIDPIKKTRLASAEYHFGEHGIEVNAADLDQYVRQALAFREEAKKRNGAGKAVPGKTPGVRCWKKSGRFIHLTSNNEIASFGTSGGIQNVDIY